MEFVAVYVREAHPSDGWHMASNTKVGIDIKQPRSFAERVGVAQKCCAALEMSMPMVVDTLDDRVGHAYSGMPDRLYIVDREGRVAYKGGRGPFGFKSGEMEQSLVMLLLEEAGKKSAAHVSLLNNTEAWKRLPPAENGANQPLPAWARALADALPRTTAAMLELDYLHRVDSPLEPRLRGLLRWTAAKANRCAYTEVQAAADLRRAGIDAAALSSLPASQAAALDFARKLSEAAYTITDDEVAELIRIHGEQQVVAMVLLVAHANFQDRLLLALGITPAVEEPGPPLEVRFRKSGDNLQQPAPRKTPATWNGDDPPPKITDLEWLALDFDQLQTRMEEQRGRAPRIAVPAWEDVQKRLPAEAANRGPLRIRWSLVCMGYQPKLAQAWITCLRTFQQEARQDRVFEELLFWIVTRSLHCAY